jgi:hypothetical protein
MNDEQRDEGGRAMPQPIGNLARRFLQLAVWSDYGRAYPVYGGWTPRDGALSLTVFGELTAKDEELLGRFE